MKSVHWPLMDRLLHLVAYSEEGAAWGRSPPRLAVPKTDHPTTANVPSVLLYNCPLFCGFNVPLKGLMNNQDRYVRTDDTSKSIILISNFTKTRE